MKRKRFHASGLLVGGFIGMLALAAREARGSPCIGTRATAGWEHSLVLDSDGTSAGWGLNVSRQLGNDDIPDTNVPVPVTGIDGLVAIDTGGAHTLAVRTDGTIWAWGSNSFGTLGIGNWNWPDRPVQVLTVTNATAVSAHYDQSLAVDATGQAWAWGANDFGQLGNGTNSRSDEPLRVGLTDVTAVSAGFYYSLALRLDGTVWAWGANGCGALGNGSLTNSNVPVRTVGLSGVTAISAGHGHALALRSDGTVWAWGCNHDGQLGVGRASPGSLVPAQVQGIAGVIAISAGGAHSLAIRGDGSLWAWGANAAGQLGDGSNISSPLPVQVANLADVVDGSAGTNHSLAVEADGEVWAFGWNTRGQLGNGTSGRGTDANVPVRVLFDAPPVDPGNVLLAVRNADDVLLDFGNAGPARGWRIYADADKRSVGITGLSPDTATPSLVDGGAIARAGDIYYLIRGLSLCSGTPGAP